MLWLLRTENIFDFSQTTFNLALSIFSRLMVSVKFHGLVVLGWPHVKELLPQRNPSLHVASLTRQLQHCMAGHQLLQFKGSTLALVIITLELERLMPDCCTPISDLLKKAQVSIRQLNRCEELVKQQLASSESSSCTSYFTCQPLCPYPNAL
ncbi:hypothetical protein CB1_000434006 [Camelus ferus]|nr:hypothetical protein CB1_000434006 [Camelus ferus]